jgi:vanillate/4-hydroxybenzoate decarboxylase subunit D
MHHFARSVEEHLHVERTPVDGTCRECGEARLATYRVLSDGGWWDVCKCQNCLASLSRERAPMFGGYTPLGLSVKV